MWILSIPAIQYRISRIASQELTNILGTKTTLQRVHIRPMDRIVLDEVRIADQEGVDMLQIERVAVQYDFLSLLRGKINIHGAQLFSPKIHLIEDSISGKMNYNFLLKLFNTGGSGEAVHLRINSLLIRRGQLLVDPHNVRIDDLSTRLAIKTITEDSIDVRVNSLSLRAQESFELENLRMVCRANRHGMKLRDFGVELPQSAISCPDLTITYDSLKHLGAPLKWKHVEMSLARGSHITPIDLHTFVPQLKNFTHPWTLDGKVIGNAEKLFLQGGVHVPTLVEIGGKATLKNLEKREKVFVNGLLTDGLITQNGLKLLANELNLNKKDSIRFTNLGEVHLQGKVNGPLQECTLKGSVQTLPGDLDLFLQAHIASLTHQEITASISSDSLAVGTILGDSAFGNAAMDINLNHSIVRKEGSKQAPQIAWAVQGDIHELGFKSYLYQNITVDVSSKNKTIQGELWADDPNGSLWINGDIDMRYRLPKINLEASLEHIRLDRLNLTKRPEAEISSQIELHCQGLHLDSIRGSLSIPSLQYRSEGHEFVTENLLLSAKTLPKEEGSKLPNRIIKLSSDFLQVDLSGQFAYRDVLKHLQNQLFSNVSSLYPVDEYAENNQHKYDLRVSIDKSDLIEEVLEIPFMLHGTSTVHMAVDEARSTSSLRAYIPRATYGANTFQSVNVSAANMPHKTFADVRLNRIRRGNAINVALHTEAHEDTVSTAINWGNNAGATYSGRIDLQTLLSHELQPQAVTSIQPTDIIIRDSIWHITPATVTWRPKYIDIDDLRISHKKQLLAVQGTASLASDDRIHLKLIDMDMEYIFNMANLSRAVDFGGMVTGEASMANAFGTPELNANLHIKNYSYNNVVLGDLHALGRWDPKEKGVHLEADCIENKHKVFTTNGYIYPAGIGGLDLSFKTDGANIAFMQFYLSSISNDIEGRGWGNLRVFGPFNAIDLEGDINITGEANIDILGTRYKIGHLGKDKDEKPSPQKPIRRGQGNRLVLKPGKIMTRQFTIHDMENHPGTVNLTLTHDHLRDMKYDVRLQTPGMLVLDTQPSDTLPFSGHVYASGSGRIYGQHNEMRCEAGLRSQRNSNFEFVLQESESSYDAPFITFRDARTTWRKQPKTAVEKEDMTSDMDIYMDIQVDATPDVQMKLIMDPQAEDNIVGTGYGNIRMTYHNKGDVNMYGRYTIRQGRYDFSLQEVIHKTFDINQGSSITFDGDPLQGNMDIQATYTVHSASLSDLGSDVSSLVDNPNVRVNCLLNLTGACLSPEIEMDIALPNERAEIERMVRNYIGTDEQMDMQIIYLLSLGKFYTQLEDDDQNQNSNMVTSVISSTLSGQLNSMISGLTNNHWNFGTNLSTGQEGWTDMEVEGMLSGRLLNNRLLVNGNFGYRESAMSETNFVGDFDVQYLLTRNGNLILKAYNKTNDHYYTRNSLTTQGLGIVFQKDFNNWNWLWFWKKKKKSVSLQTEIPGSYFDEPLDAFNAPNNQNSKNKATEDQSSTPNLEFDFIKYEQAK